MKAKNFIISFLAIFTLVWAIDALWLNPIVGEQHWVIRKNAIYLTGVLSMALMSLTMVLALRTSWLENLFNGLDKTYYIHKWAGIYAILFGGTHWLIKLSGAQLAAIYGAEGKPSRDAVLVFMNNYRSLGKDLGEWSIYLLLGLLAIALFKKIPYRPWRLLHKLMPFIYIALVIHTLALTPLDYWTGVSGALIIATIISGTVAAMYVLMQQIGKRNKYSAKIKRINIINGNTLEISCSIDKSWPGHAAGQFVFIKFEPHECAHPFTIASFDEQNKNLLSFKIKALGDYTKKLFDSVHQGQAVQIEGPYGRFDFNSTSEQTPQVWIAAGIGVTPFIAKLQGMQNKLSNQKIDMYYCVANAVNDSLVSQIKKLCKNLPNVNLYIQDASSGQRLNAKTILDKQQAKNMDIWFCGPNKFANNLKNSFKNFKLNNINFHQEIFEFR